MMMVLLQKELGDEFIVESAGIRKDARNQHANRHTVWCMRGLGVDLSTHRGRWTGDLDLSTFSFIVCPEREQAGEVSKGLPPGAHTAVIVVSESYDEIPPLFGKGLATFRQCHYLLNKIIPKVANQIRSR